MNNELPESFMINEIYNAEHEEYAQSVRTFLTHAK